MAPLADYTDSEYFSTETVTITIDATDYTFNKFKVNETSFDEYITAVVEGTECITNFTNDLVEKFTAALDSFKDTSKCNDFKTGF